MEQTNMDAEPPLPHPSSTSSAPLHLLLRPRRETFEHGLLPIPKLIFSDGTLTLASLKATLLRRPTPFPHLVDAPAFADALDISLDHARLALQTLAAVLPSDPGAAAAAAADVHDLLLFLYVQSYKRLLPKAHKDPTAVADVWPSTSAFDAHLSALSPVQVSPLLFMPDHPTFVY